jgi:hypothetical protein
VGSIPRQAGRSDGDAKPAIAAIGDEHDGVVAELPADREDGKAATEEGMGRVGYLDLLGWEFRWVVERGIMEGARSTRSPTIG